MNIILLNLTFPNFLMHELTASLGLHMGSTQDGTLPSIRLFIQSKESETNFGNVYRPFKFIGLLFFRRKEHAAWASIREPGEPIHWRSYNTHLVRFFIILQIFNSFTYQNAPKNLLSLHVVNQKFSSPMKIFGWQFGLQLVIVNSVIIIPLVLL